MINGYYIQESMYSAVREALREQEPFCLMQLQQFFVDTLVENTQAYTQQTNPLVGNYTYATCKVFEQLEAYMSALLQQSMRITKSTSYRFEQGGYLSIQTLPEDGYSVFIDISATQTDCGGNIVVTDGQGNHMHIAQQQASCTLLKHQPSLFWYIQYANHYMSQQREYIHVLLQPA